MKKLLSILLAGTMLFIFVACGDDSKYKDAYVTEKNNAESVDSDADDVGDVADDEEVIFAGVQIGDYITFGSYEQDNVYSNGGEPIEWLVLDEQDGKMLVISKYAIDCKLFNESGKDVMWKECTLCNWLNEEFINEAFSDQEKTRIAMVNTAASDNQFFEANSGEYTGNKIFLLSIDEAEKYFELDEARECKPTVYAITQGASICYEGYCSWWLRSPGAYHGGASLVGNDGDIYYDGDDYIKGSVIAVRPALWINL